MAVHAKLSPSSAERWGPCPGSVALCEGLPNTSNDYSDEGTAAHYLASVCLTCDTQAKAYIGRAITVGDWGEAFSEHADKKGRYTKLIDDDFAVAVQDYLDYVREVVSSTKGKLHIEQRLSLEGITGEEDAEGTSDAVIVTQDELIIIDLKFGMGVRKEAEGNPQLIIYGLAAMDKYGIIHDYNDVRLVIHQPRLNHVSEFTYTVEEMEAFRLTKKEEADKVNRAVDAYGSIDSIVWQGTYTKAGEDQCRFCLAKATCPTLAAHIVETIDAEFEDMSNETVEEAKHLDPETLSRNLKAVDLIEGWCKAVRAGVEGLLLAGVAVPDFKLVQGKKGHRQWSDPAEIETVFKSMRLKVDEMYDLKLISPTTAEKVLKESPKRWTRVLPFIVQKEGGPSVAPASDKRPALSMEVEMEDHSEPESLI